MFDEAGWPSRILRGAALVLAGVLAGAVFLAAPEARAEDGKSGNATAPEEASTAESNGKAADSTSGGEVVTMPIIISGDYGSWESLGGSDPADIGKTVIGRDSFEVRTDGSGDANSFLRSMPNVQYRNDIDEDPGEDTEDVIDLKPALFSISGGRVYENSFILNGMPINSVTGSVERSDAELTTDGGIPNADVVYGLHPQTLYVPDAFVRQVTVQDSNISAEYGGFQGGVVEYDLMEPSRDRYVATADGSYQNDDFVHYKIGTEDGTNPLGREHPEFSKNSKAISLSGPINDRLAWIGAISQQQADTSKQRVYKYYDGWVDEESESIFAHGALTFDSGIGEFKFSGSMTDYEQDWESPAYYEMQVDTKTKTYATQLRHRADLPGFGIGGLLFDNLKTETTAYYSDSNTENISNGNELYSYTKRYRTGWVASSPELDEWCRLDPTVTGTANQICYRGGYGDRKEQGQKDLGIKTKLTADVGAGNLLFGGEVMRQKGLRSRADDFTFYSGTTTLPQATSVTSFTCLDPNDKACSSEQYTSTKTIWKAFDTSVEAVSANAYAELSQRWGWFGLRLGARLDYEDYLKNLNIAPRLSATVSPLGGVDITAGFNRYYASTPLYYAIRDAQPRGQAYTRTHDSSGNVSNTWTMRPATGNYTYAGSGLDTPFTDEFAAGIAWAEPYFGGTFRLRGIDREGKDQFATSSSQGTSVASVITNDGTSMYRSATLEYEKFWNEIAVAGLDRIGFSTSATWSEQAMSNDTYIADDGLDTYIYYNGRSYTVAEFDKVTGNLDIPVKVNLALRSFWFDDRLQVGTSANINMPYTGVRDTGTNVNVGGFPHDLYEDYDFGVTATVDLMAQLTVTRWRDGGLDLTVRVDNLFDDIGNPIATNNNPFMRGRTFWLGASAKF